MSESADGVAVAALAALGFPEVACRNALEMTGDPDAAANLLLSGSEGESAGASKYDTLLPSLDAVEERQMCRATGRALEAVMADDADMLRAALGALPSLATAAVETRSWEDSDGHLTSGTFLGRVCFAGMGFPDVIHSSDCFEFATDDGELLRDGDTLLHICSRYEKRECITALLAAGAPVLAENAVGETPLVARLAAAHRSEVEHVRSVQHSARLLLAKRPGVAQAQLLLSANPLESA